MVAKRNTRGAARGPRATIIRGARAHNLQGVDCEIPLGQVTAITGVSGSGKSTLAFDVLYAEGQRRFVECLSAYARQFLERLERPAADEIGFIQPPIALKQRVSIKNARSTVGSITELTDYLRLLLVHAGELHCLQCGGDVGYTGVDEAVAALARWPSGTQLAVVVPLAATPDATTLRRLRSEGYGRLLCDGRSVEIDDLLAREAGSIAGSVDLVVDRVIAGKARRSRIAEALESAWLRGQGACTVRAVQTGDLAGDEPLHLRRGLACRTCGTAASEPTAALFSWNSPLGACPTCQGFGRVMTIDRDKVVPDAGKTLRNHAVVPFSVPSARSWFRRMLKAASVQGIPSDIPFAQLTPEQQAWVLDGDRAFPGVAGFFTRLERKRYKMHVRIFIARFRGYIPCPHCRGTRLKPEALAATLGGKDIHALHEMPIRELGAFITGLALPRATRARVQPLLDSIRVRLEALDEIGVGYLTLARSGRTLSGGETQRIRIAAALGNSLTDTLFVLDEPTVGLHAVDTARMQSILRRLAATGNTVVVVEHDPAIIAGADHLIVLGPGGGRDGGRIVYQGPVREFFARDPGFFFIDPGPLPTRTAGRRRPRGKLTNPWNAEAVHGWIHPAATIVPAANQPQLRITGATEHNLRIPDLRIPAAGLTVVTGISGSGKSTLLDEVIYRSWLRRRGRPVEGVGSVTSIEGLAEIDEAHFVGQDLLGRSSRSNPISFVQAYGEIRALLAATGLARRHRFDAGTFSFNTPRGRCEACRGMGTQTLEMFFLPDVDVTCESCGGKRFRPEVLQVEWQGKNIHEILNLTVDEAAEFFATQPRVVARLEPLRAVGLGYLILGQSTATLSGGEAQRLKIAAFLAQTTARQHHLFLFDEPTTGLHARDVGRLLGALRGLIAVGHGVIAVEHHLDFIRAADWVIDLGPGAGDAGGQVVYSGAVAGLLAHETSLTAQALREHLARSAAVQPAESRPRPTSR